jgi:predicted metal-dependent hydrolase
MSGKMKEPVNHTSVSISSGVQSIVYQVRYSNRARRWRISVTAEKIEIVLPEGSHLRPDKLIKEYADWIIEKQTKLQKHKARIKKRSLPEGQILFQGKPVTIDVKSAAFLRNPGYRVPGSIRVITGRFIHETTA